MFPPLAPDWQGYRGAFNDLHSATLGAAAVKEAVARAGVDPSEVDDVIMGAALQQGAQGGNVALKSHYAQACPQA